MKRITSQILIKVLVGGLTSLFLGMAYANGNADSSTYIDSHFNNMPITVAPATPINLEYSVKGALLKKVVVKLDNLGAYSNLTLYADDSLLIDHLNIPSAGEQTVSALVKFNQLGNTQLSIRASNASFVINKLSIEDFTGLELPQFKDISEKAGLDKVSSIKYGGPTIADFDNDGDYDFIVNNHNAEPSKLYWNNGDGTVTKHKKDLARWFMHDLHGTAAGDYDNDGDLDLVVTMGGGNGKNPSKANFYQHYDDRFVLSTGDVGIDRGGRGRGAKFIDLDLDGDLDLMLINEASLTHSKPQHYFYENLGDGTFKYKSIKGIEDEEPSRALVTDLNNDNIDDIILYSPFSVWQGNGDFTFTDITHQLPQNIAKLKDVMAITDIDIDNDGDRDLYLARGKVFERGFGEAPSVDHNPMTKEFSIKPRGYKGVDAFEFTADGVLKFHQYKFLTQGAFRGKDYPIFLGKDKHSTILSVGEELEILPENAMGWPDDISANGVYFGHIGNNRWKAALVRNGDIFWTFRFSLSGVKTVDLAFEPENRNIADVLLKNDNGKFTDVSEQWNVPTGGNALGVTVGDFNNDNHQDLFVYRWGKIGSRISDYMLLNNGKGNFEITTMHGANDVGGPGNGDMGQAFDFDLDGDLDLLNGSEDGQWYLYQNDLVSNQNNHFALVRVGYSPKDNVDAVSAQVVIKTPLNEYHQRVGSAGAVFSQSLMNIVHFALGKEEKLESISIRWRNGETVVLNEKTANKLYFVGEKAPSLSAVNKENSKNYQLMNTPCVEGRGEACVEPFIEIENAESYQNKAFVVGDELTLTVNYHAGSGNKVIASDEGGIRFWLREFKYKWIPAKDTILTEPSALYTESGSASKTFSLEGFTPSDELPEGHFYYLNASFANSNGDVLKHEIYPISIVKDDSVKAVSVGKQ